MPDGYAAVRVLPRWPPGVTPLDRGAPCRYCTRIAWLTDTTGPLHTCCADNAPRFASGLDCPSCYASQRAANRDYDYTAIDRRAIASGRRRSTLAGYRQAQTETAQAKEPSCAST